MKDLLNALNLISFILIISSSVCVGQGLMRVKIPTADSELYRLQQNHDTLIVYTFYCNIRTYLGKQPDCHPDEVAYCLYKEGGEFVIKKEDCNGPYEAEFVKGEKVWNFLLENEEQIFDPEFKTIFYTHGCYFQIDFYTNEGKRKVVLNSAQLKKNEKYPKNPKAEKLINRIKKVLPN